MASERSVMTTTSKSTACPLLDKLPSELRVKIYGFLWAMPEPRSPWDQHLPPTPAYKGGDRRIYWKSEGISRTVSGTSPKSFNTAILRVCKLTYEEALSELVSKHTVVVELDVLKPLPFYYSLVNRMRHLELRDTKSAGNSQVRLLGRLIRGWPRSSEPPVYAPIQRSTVKPLPIVRKVLMAAPTLKHVVLGFEMLGMEIVCKELVEMPSMYPWQALEQQLQSIWAEARFAPIACRALGTWRVQLSESLLLEVKHYNIIKIFEEFVGSDCGCRGNSASWHGHLLGLANAGKRHTAERLYRRHMAAMMGIFGEEAEMRCGGNGLKASATWAEKSLRMGVVLLNADRMFRMH